jgi:FixJ family two-component response regulator
MRTDAPKIVLVENDHQSSRAFQRLLNAHGYAVQAFYSAESYLARASELGVDCFLLDVNLDGMSGLELQQQINLLPSGGAPIVFMTGRHQASVEQRARDQGCAGFLYKPFDGLTLTTAIDMALAGRR